MSNKLFYFMWIIAAFSFLFLGYVFGNINACGKAGYTFLKNFDCVNKESLDYCLLQSENGEPDGIAFYPYGKPLNLKNNLTIVGDDAGG